MEKRFASSIKKVLAGGKVTFVVLSVLIFIFSSAPVFAANPASDPNNTGNWKVNWTFTDEFSGGKYDSHRTAKWNYLNTNWAGRNPAMFHENNVRVSNGLLMIDTINHNMINNGSFEQNNLTSWSTWGTAKIAVGSTSKQQKPQEPIYRGKYGIQLGASSGASQYISGLSPNTDYKLILYGRNINGAKISCSVKNYGGPDKYAGIDSANFKLATIAFKTGSNNTSAHIGFSNMQAAGTVYIDEVAVVKKWIDGQEMKGDYYYTAGTLRSRNLTSRGYYEVKMKVSASCTTSSFWLRNPSTQEEIDVVEAVGRSIFDADSRYHMPTNLHAFKHDLHLPQTIDTGVDLANGYHTYGVEWDANKIVYFFDGVPKRTIWMSSVAWATDFSQPQNVLIDSEIFSWHGMPDKGFSTTLYVDYIRAWTK